MSFINISDPRRRDEIVKSFLATRHRIKQENLKEKIGDLAKAEDTKQMFDPIIKSNIKAAEEISKDLVPIRKELENLNQEIALANFQPALLPPEIEGRSTPQRQRRRSLPSVPTPQQLGQMPIDYLRQALSSKKDNDSIFGIYNEEGQFKIGNLPIRIDGNDLVVDGRRYTGSEGLWSLLTKKNPINYSQGDLQNYKQILLDTDALYQNNNRAIRRPKSSASPKWTLVKPFWDELKGKKSVLQPSKLADAFGNLNPYAGKGVGALPTVYLSSDPVELMDRLQLLIAEFKAGNKTTRNEIVAITDELLRKGILDTSQYKALNSSLFV